VARQDTAIESRASLPTGFDEYPANLAALLSLGGVAGIAQPTYLDVESTGLNAGAGTIVFLVGLAQVVDGECIVQQFFLRDPADEPDLLAQIASALRPYSALITFNGKRFDAPLLGGRYTLHRAADPLPAEHLDLLPPSRRIWGRRLGQTSLTALESRILGIVRGPDVPGRDIPRRYFEYVRDGKSEAIIPVLAHNRHDLLAMVLLAGRIAALLAEPGRATGTAPSDLVGLGGLLEASGRADGARQCYQAALAGSSALDRAEALFRLATLTDKSTELERVVELLEVVAGYTVDRAVPASIELAKIFEHRTREPERALTYARRAFRLLRERPAPTTAITLPEVSHRIARLERKVQASNR
jgi:hypothetical protein